MNKYLITFLFLIGILLSACGASEEMMEDKTMEEKLPVNNGDEPAQEAVVIEEEEEIIEDIASEDEDVEIGDLI